MLFTINFIFVRVSKELSFKDRISYKAKACLIAPYLYFPTNIPREIQKPTVPLCFISQAPMVIFINFHPLLRRTFSANHMLKRSVADVERKRITLEALTVADFRALQY